MNYFVLVRLNVASVPRVDSLGQLKRPPNYIQSLNENKGTSNHESQPSTHLKHRPTHHTKPSPDNRGALFPLHHAPTSRQKRHPVPDLCILLSIHTASRSKPPAPTLSKQLRICDCSPQKTSKTTFSIPFTSSSRTGHTTEPIHDINRTVSRGLPRRLRFLRCP